MTIKKDHLTAIQKTVNEVQDLLRKSGVPMMKEEEDDLQSQSMEGEEPQMDEGMEPQMDEGMEPQMDEGMEEPMEDEGDMEGGEEDHMAEMKEHAASMSDEDLQMLLQMLTEEMEARQGDEDEGMEEPSMDEEPEMEMDKSTDKEDYIKLHKSISSMVERMEGIAKDVTELKKAPKKSPVRNRAAATNAPDVLHKSKTVEPVKSDRLNKSDTIQFLYGQIKQGNPALRSLGGSTIVAKVNTLQDGSAELHQVQDDLAKEGIVFPKL